MESQHLIANRNLKLRYISKQATGCVGLRNQGNTCYMNSYLQTLYHLSFFAKQVLNIPSNQKIDNFPDALQILFYDLLTGTTQQQTTNLLKSFGWEYEDAQVQHDIQEFGCHLIETLEQNMDKYPELKGSVQKLFQGQTIYYIKCINVNFKTERIEPFFDIQLQVKDMRSLKDSLIQYTQEEMLIGDNIYDTGDQQYGKQDAKRGAKFKILPPVLQITLKRFEYDKNYGYLKKILDPYEYPLILDMKPFMNLYNSKKSDNNEFQYELFAVLIHSGQYSGSGHYYAYIKKQKQWFKFNDSVVEKISESQALQGGRGGNATHLVWKPLELSGFFKNFIS
ncbi:hypothetical protein IMG5_116130 [Ichthyophthirius multifiliis]|uniref:USP domain-containing protein n=1 Tax=Ichthyophthirius multifiliis TaxID=5932 RepID=G0QUB5_ICHMU|nr:hypothetical protein IMG5_116130 [Ichthyophthirius multifiliis]EGR31187.1 hypothetical protein IMG5_116130 [Ichthyophthirius multifiliis]|eukprot:XP_004034673.1 hypothetical protein IMG5_116130 [Ichthyophthirius multifiliis]